ncbi:MAG TPA: hypothetical protein VMT20_16920 [Terriglobia bacterium]|nr:hypothetical protein [Terriglobia bacterium]
MPFQWIDPEILTEYRGIRIYHTYKDDDFEQPSEFWYKAENGEDSEFDVRDLPAADGVTAWSWSSGDVKVLVSTGRDTHLRIIKAAIDREIDPFARLLESEETDGDSTDGG